MLKGFPLQWLWAYRHATTYGCFRTIKRNELPMLLRHRAVRKNTHTHTGLQRIPTAALSSCRQTRATTLLGWRILGFNDYTVDGRNPAPLSNPQLKPRAPNLILFEDGVIKMDSCDSRKSCTTCQHVIQHWTWGYGGTSYALANVML